MGTLKPQSNGPFYSNTVIGTLAVDGWTVIFGTATVSEEGPGWAAVPPRPLIAVPNLTAHSSMAIGQSINFILLDVALLLPVPIKGLSFRAVLSADYRLHVQLARRV